MAQNTKVATEVLADEHASHDQKTTARELVRLTELNLMTAIGAYLRTL